MQRAKYPAALVAIAFFLNACNSGNIGKPAALDESSYQTTTAEASYEEEIDSDGSIPLQSDARKIIHTMNVKFRTKDVQRSVAAIEYFANSNNGIVAASNTTNQTTNNKSVKYRSDSLRNAHVYTTIAQMTVRVPVDKLDTLTGLLNGLSEFTDYRKLNRQDVTFNLIANDLKTKADKKTDDLINKNATAKNIGKTIDYTDRIAQRDAERSLRNMELLDEVKYATVNLELYQPERVVTFVIQDVDGQIHKTYGERVNTSLAWSFDLIKAVSLAVIALWPVWLVAAIIALIVRRRKKLISL